nr:hypothetical protein [Tanacetum cinerariifolium]
VIMALGGKALDDGDVVIVVIMALGGKALNDGDVVIGKISLDSR